MVEREAVAGTRGVSRRRLSLAALMAATGSRAGAGDAADPVGALLKARIETGRDSVGYVAALADAAGTRIVTAGQADPAVTRPLDGDTVFEIGSITKVFTALLLAEMVGRGEVGYSDPVAQYLPIEGRPREFDGKPISLLDLATYTSGLPRMPENITSRDQANPYAEYTVAQLYAFLAGYPPRYYPGSRYEYANLGFGLLGHALSLRSGRSYEELLVTRVCDPLGLSETRITLSPAMQPRLTPGHDAGLRTVPNWDLPAMAGAGALRSTANDLLRFLLACQGRIETPLAGAIARLLDVRRQTDMPEEVAAAGWFVHAAYGDELVWKDGGTGGYASFIGYSTRTGRGAVLLANAAAYATTRQIGWHLVVPGSPLPVLHRVAAADPSTLAAYAGRYALRPDFMLTVTPRDGHLMVQATNQAEYEVFPVGERNFIYRVVDAQLKFEMGADGVPEAVVLHQNGRDQRAARVP